MLTLAALILAVVPLAEPLRDTVDVLESNRFYDSEGRLVFHQQIGWLWYGDVGQHHVCYWRMVKDPGQIPVFDHARGDWVSRWWDNGTHREVRSRSFVESWSQTDPESLDREFLPPPERRGLSGETTGKLPRGTP